MTHRVRKLTCESPLSQVNGSDCALGFMYLLLNVTLTYILALYTCIERFRSL